MTAMKAFFRWKPVESGCGDGGAVEQAIEPERAQPSLIRYPSVDRARPVNLRVVWLGLREMAQRHGVSQLADRQRLLVRWLIQPSSDGERLRQV